MPKFIEKPKPKPFDQARAHQDVQQAIDLLSSKLNNTDVKQDIQRLSEILSQLIDLIGSQDTISPVLNELNTTKTSLLEAVERLQQPEEWHFDIERNENNRLTGVKARKL